MSEVSEYKAPLSCDQVQELLPHRFPFLLIDRVLELKPGESITAIKCVTMNEPWVQGHFPNRPVMPGVLMIEALAQAGAIMLLVLPKYRKATALLAGITDLRFRRVVVPGDVLKIEIALDSIRMGMGKASGTATVDGELAVKGQLQFAIFES